MNARQVEVETNRPAMILLAIEEMAPQGEGTT